MGRQQNLLLLKEAGLWQHVGIANLPPAMAEETSVGANVAYERKTRLLPTTSALYSLSSPLFQALLKMDCQGLVARLVMDFVLLTTAVEVAGRWRELAERLTKISRLQMDAYEAPHRDKNGIVDSEVGAALQHLRIKN